MLRWRTRRRIHRFLVWVDPVSHVAWSLRHHDENFVWREEDTDQIPLIPLIQDTSIGKRLDLERIDVRQVLLSLRKYKWMFNDPFSQGAVGVSMPKVNE